MKPLVSILIPVFNCEMFLSETIQSALHQTWTNIEIIIVDDGSTDNSLAIAKTFERDFVTVYHQANMGACAARNFGLNKSKGDYIQFLDGDDILPPEKIENQMRILMLNPNALIGCTWVRFRSTIDNTLGESGPSQSIRSNLLPEEWLLKRQMMCLHSWLTPKSLIEKAGSWNVNLKANQDGEYFYRIIANADQVLFDPSSTVFYRTEPNHPSISKIDSPQKLDSLYRSALTYKKVMNDLNVNEMQRKISIGNFFKELEYLFYPDCPELFQKCQQQHETQFSTIKFKGGLKTNLLSRIVGWKASKRIKKSWNFWQLRQPRFLENQIR